MMLVVDAEWTLNWIREIHLVCRLGLFLVLSLLPQCLSVFLQSHIFLGSHVRQQYRTKQASDESFGWFHIFYDRFFPLRFARMFTIPSMLNCRYESKCWASEQKLGLRHQCEVRNWSGQWGKLPFWQTTYHAVDCKHSPTLTHNHKAADLTSTLKRNLTQFVFLVLTVYWLHFCGNKIWLWKTKSLDFPHFFLFFPTLTFTGCGCNFTFTKI